MNEIHKAKLQRRDDGKYDLTIEYSAVENNQAAVRPLRPTLFAIEPAHVPLPQAVNNEVTEVLTIRRLGTETSCDIEVRLDESKRVPTVDVP